MKQLSVDTFFDELSAKACETRSPEGVTFELTYGCNLRCVHCLNPTHRALPRELNTEEVFEILEQLVALGVIRITFTGGELFVRPDVLPIFRRAKDQGLLLSLISNATRITPTIAETLRELAFESVNISIYGASKATYEGVTGIPGSHDLFLRGLEALASKDIPAVVRMPVMIGNVDEIHHARSLVEGYGFKFQYCLDISPKTNGDTSPLRVRLTAADKVRINQAMVGYAAPTPQDTACPADQAFISCSCGRNRFAITPYGEMNLCVVFPIPKYDLRSGTVKEGWEALKRTVDEAKSNERYECPTCEMRPYCKQGPSDAWLETGDMSPCLPHFKEFARLEQRAHEYLDPRRPA